ncbi:MAG: hypothetical protein ACI3Z5_02450 [Paludibacteraceae bacterium]
MAKITFIDPVTSLSGTLDEHSKIYYRTRNGRTHAYKINRPFAGEATELQAANRHAFGDRVRLAGEILRDADLREEWQKLYDAYLLKVRRHPASYPNPYSTLRGFIIAALTGKTKS